MKLSELIEKLLEELGKSELLEKVKEELEKDGGY